MDYVNQNANPPKKTRLKGRPIAFDRADVIDRAVDLFWKNGFDDASLDDLVAGLGVSRSTLYNSFGGKDGLHETALDQYLDQVERVIIGPLREGTSGLADVMDFIDRVEHVLTSNDMPSGCLLLNDMAAARNSAAVSRYLAGLQDAIAAGLSRAEELGEINKSSLGDKASVVLAAVIGANHIANAGTQVQTNELLKGLRVVVSEWART